MEARAVKELVKQLVETRRVLADLRAEKTGSKASIARQLAERMPTLRQLDMPGVLTLTYTPERPTPGGEPVWQTATSAESAIAALVLALEITG